MKNITFYDPEKYADSAYKKVAEHIYKTYDAFMGQDCYVTSFCFEQERQLGEGNSPQEISRYPLEDILDKYYVAVEDTYDAENRASAAVCYLEFSANCQEDIQNLLEIVGKHVYNREKVENGKRYIELVIE